MHKKTYFMSIKLKIMLICLLVLIIPIFVMTFISYSSTQKQLVQKYTELMMDIAKQTNIRIDEYLKEVEKISLVASFGMNSGAKIEDKENYPLQKFLRKDNEENESVAYGMLMNYMTMKDREISFYVYNLNGGRDLFVGTDLPYDYSYNAKEEDWFIFFQASGSKMMTLDTHIDKQTMSKKPVISHARKILDMDSGTLLGIMVVRIDLGVIEVVNSRLQQALRSRFTIVDQTDNIIFNQNTSLIGKKFHDTIPLDEKANIIVTSPVDRQNWTTYLYMPISELSTEGSLLRQNIFLLAVLMLVFLGIVVLFLSNVITRPIKKLMNNMLLVEKGLFEQVESVDSRDEIGLLSNRFIRMSHELSQLIVQIQSEEKEKAAVEMKALQSQINPHFLYNTLGSVKWIASLQQADTIVEMTDSLIAMLRYAARGENALVTVREELDNLRNYMVIQNVRYFERISLVIQADESLLGQAVPKLILQPLVENAIFHGLAEIEEDGIITIEIVRKQGRCVISVHDNGMGMDASYIQQMLDRGQSMGDSIGLVNVQRRIRLHYGHGFGLACSSSPELGTIFLMELPITYLV